MTKLVKILAILVLIWLMGPGLAAADSPRILDKSFSGATKIHIRLVSSDCVIAVADGARIRVKNETTKSPDRYKPEVSMENKVVTVSEDFSGSGHSHGRSRWFVWVPRGVAVGFRSASGDLEVHELGNALDISTASGDVSLDKLSGRTEIHTASGDVKISGVTVAVEIHTASGDVNIKKSRGGISVKSASGDIDISGAEGVVNVRTASGDVELKKIHGSGDVRSASGEIEVEELISTGEWTLSAASGSIKVKLGARMEHDMTLSSASGSVLLDFDGNPVQGNFELLAAFNRGEIRCAEKGNTETVFRRGTKFSRLSFSRGDKPAISLRTHSGTVEIRR